MYHTMDEMAVAERSVTAESAPSYEYMKILVLRRLTVRDGSTEVLRMHGGLIIP